MFLQVLQIIQNEIFREVLQIIQNETFLQVLQMLLIIENEIFREVFRLSGTKYSGGCCRLSRAKHCGLSLTGRDIHKEFGT
jgi:hypothetical protein